MNQKVLLVYQIWTINTELWIFGKIISMLFAKKTCVSGVLFPKKTCKPNLNIFYWHNVYLWALLNQKYV